MVELHGAHAPRSETVKEIYLQWCEMFEFGCAGVRRKLESGDVQLKKSGKERNGEGVRRRLGS